MTLLPPVLPLTLLALVASVALVGGGAWLVYAWAAGIVIGTTYLVAGIAMLVWTLAGRWIVLALLGRHGQDDPVSLHGREVDRIRRPDGTEIHLECFGPQDAPPLVLTHGWGMNTAEWYYVKKALADRFRLMVWDLRGMGRTSRPPGRDYRLETMAGDLDAVLARAGAERAILVGHSIGGMVTLTFCRLFAAALRDRVAGIVLVDTTYTNPVRTTTASGFFTAIQQPVLVPLLHLVTWLSLPIWGMNWLSYQNGTAHLISALTGFGGSQTRGQLEFVTRVSNHASPAALARGVLAMFRYDATAALPGIDVPALVVTGDKDRVLVPETSARMHDALAAAELVSLAPAGHMSLLERHEPFVDAVAAFAERCAAQRVPYAAPSAA
jgi:pimeloyl-ACP methyl ester carboxylesterase